ncbi:MAG: hypothetical protein K2G90_09715 [Muribaculaceae bacterium]|nr:hypothetical protein [Muribaculaceae bacterium]
MLKKELAETKDSKEEPPLTSSMLRMGGGTFLKILATRYLLTSIALIFLSVTTLTILAVTVDIRWAIVLLMLILLILPLAAAFLYFNHGLKEITVLNTLSHTLSFDTAGILIVRYEGEEPAARRFLPYSEFSRFYVATDYVILPMKDKKRGFLWLPSSGFEQQEDLTEVMKKVGAGVRTDYL